MEHNLPRVVQAQVVAAAQSGQQSRIEEDKMELRGRSFARTCLRAWVLAPILASAAIFAVAEATAAPVTYSYSGVIDFVDPALSGGFSTGDLLAGTYTFESTTPARAGSTAAFAVFDALLNVSFTIGAYGASSAGAPEIQVDDAPSGAPNDRYAVLARASDGLTGAAVGGLDLSTFGFRLDDSTNAAFSTALTLPEDLSFGAFDSSAFFVFFEDKLLFGHLTTLERVAVSEPGIAALLALALAAFGLARQRARR
jgi:hypothetical protein